jgi:phage terminase Nu1 subunit (DNA packaging protein)
MNVTTNADLIEAKTRLTNIKADQAAIKLKLMQGEYVPLCDVEKRQAEEVTRVRTKLLALPSKLARRLSGKTFSIQEVSDVLTEAVNEALSELSNSE